MVFKLFQNALMIAADEFYSIYSHGLVRVAACTLPVAPANPMDNARRTAELIMRPGRRRRPHPPSPAVR